jgi:hypothetical protein
MIKLRLREVLNEHSISAYRLGQEVEGLNPKTVQMYASGMRQPSLEGLNKLLAALQRLTGEPIGVSDLLEYQPEPEPMDAETRAWHDSDLSRLGEYEPYDWGDVDPETIGEPLRLGER